LSLSGAFAIPLDTRRQVGLLRGYPGMIVSDIAPGKPTHNRFVENFNGHLRDQCLNEYFDPLKSYRVNAASSFDVRYLKK
jgi:Integrase core domain